MNENLNKINEINQKEIHIIEYNKYVMNYEDLLTQK